jgi:hypothetical protein
MLQDSILEGLVREVVSDLLSEARSIKSSKLSDILKSHGGLYKDVLSRGRHVKNYAGTDLHGMEDSQILGVLSPSQVRDIQSGHTVDHWRWSDNYGLDIWAKENGVKLDKGDRVETLKLGDGSYLVYVERNAEFEHSGREGGFKDYYLKRKEREKNRPSDGYVAPSGRGKAVRDLRQNPYYWDGKNGTLHDRNSGWTDASRRKEVMDYAKSGKDQFGKEVKV